MTATFAIRVGHLQRGAGGVLTISFDIAGTFDFKDYHDDTTAADGQWKIRQDAGIHPFPPGISCTAE
ncbi:MAG: hypothetical protein PVJ57_06970 [Phycisphaerae bacterium]